MKGLEILKKRCEEFNIKFNVIDVDNNDLNKNVILTYDDGLEAKTNIIKLAEFYGSLTFLYCEPDEAITEIINILKIDATLKQKIQS